MRSFMYTIHAPVGMHARHAGLLVREAGRFQSDVRIAKGGQSVNAKGILAVMSLGVKQGDVVELTIDGPDEDAAYTELKNYLFRNF